MCVILDLPATAKPLTEWSEMRRRAASFEYSIVSAQRKHYRGQLWGARASEGEIGFDCARASHGRLG